MQYHLFDTLNVQPWRLLTALCNNHENNALEWAHPHLEIHQYLETLSQTTAVDFISDDGPGCTVACPSRLGFGAPLFQALASASYLAQLSLKKQTREWDKVITIEKTHLNTIDQTHGFRSTSAWISCSDLDQISAGKLPTLRVSSHASERPIRELRILSNSLKTARGGTLCEWRGQRVGSPEFRNSKVARIQGVWW